MNCDSAQLSCLGNIIIKQNELVFLFGLSRSYENDRNSVSFSSVRLRLFMKRDYNCFPYFEERSVSHNSIHGIITTGQSRPYDETHFYHGHESAQPHDVMQQYTNNLFSRAQLGWMYLRNP